MFFFIRGKRLNKKNNQLQIDNMLSFDEIDDVIWKTHADVFIPCAASRLLTLDNINSLIDSGVSLIACGANVPFADKEIFYGSIAEYADKNLSVIPDFISNCGMARVFAYLMDERRIELNDQAIFNDCSKVIYEALLDCYNYREQKTNITANALELALKKINKQKY